MIIVGAIAAAATYAAEPVKPAAAKPPAAAPAKAPAAESAAPKADESSAKADKDSQKDAAAGKATAAAGEEGETAPPASAADKGKPSPQRFVPSEQVRADFDVSFPIDI
jgi:hypothetical protein